MTQDELPNTIEELQQMILAMDRQLQTTQQQVVESQQQFVDAQQSVLKAERSAALEKQKSIELTATIESQQKQLESSQRTIRELLQALRGKQRERIDPNQLLLFELGELQQLIEEQLEAEQETTPKRRQKKRRRRTLPENLPREEIVHELPEAQRLCPIDGRPMPVIRYETIPLSKKGIRCCLADSSV
jgi:hypothetical protein